VARILYVAVDGWHFRNHQLPVALAARRAGHEVAAAAAADRYAPEIEAAGVEFLPLPLRKSRSPRHAWAALRALTRLLRSRRPELVQLSSLRVAALGGLAVRRAGVPAMVRVLTGRGYVYTEASWPLRAAVSACWRSGRAPRSWTVFQNPDDRRDFLERRLAEAGASSVVPGSGVDLDRFQPRPESAGPPALLYLGRMLRSKGVGALVQSSQELRRAGIEHRLQLAGAPDPGNPASLSERQLRAWQESGAAEWLGHRRDAPELLAGCAALVLPSAYGEGMPRVLLEAAACGRPAVTTDAPGCADAVRDGETGLLVPAGDSPALTEALARLLRAPELRRQMGQRARRLAEAEFGLEVVAGHFLEVYEHLLGGSAAPPPPVAPRSSSGTPSPPTGRSA